MKYEIKVLWITSSFTILEHLCAEGWEIHFCKTYGNQEYFILRRLIEIKREFLDIDTSSGATPFGRDDKGMQ